jgi:hypothetical protein
MIYDNLPTPNITDSLVSDVTEIMASVDMNTTMVGSILVSGAKLLSLATSNNPTEEQKAVIRKEMWNTFNLLRESTLSQPGLESLETNLSFFNDPQNHEITQIAMGLELDLLNVLENPGIAPNVVSNPATMDKWSESTAKVIEWFKLRLSNFFLLMV